MSQTPLFRIGGVYRDEAGRLCLLSESRGEDRALCEVIDDSGWALYRAHHRLLADGRDPSNYTLECGSQRHLIPGELVNINGEWKSASELFIVDSKTPTLDKMEAEKEEDSFKFYDEGWNAAHDGMPFNPSATRAWRDGWNDYQDAGPEHKIRLDDGLGEAVRQATTREPTRPALDWNKPANTDRFPGFTVTSHCANEPKACGLHSPDLKQSSHQVEAVFGSAELVRR